MHHFHFQWITGQPNLWLHGSDRIQLVINNSSHVIIWHPVVRHSFSTRAQWQTICCFKSYKSLLQIACPYSKILGAGVVILPLEFIRNFIWHFSQQNLQQHRAYWIRRPIGGNFSWSWPSQDWQPFELPGIWARIRSLGAEYSVNLSKESHPVLLCSFPQDRKYGKK